MVQWSKLLIASALISVVRAGCSSNDDLIKIMLSSIILSSITIAKVISYYVPMIFRPKLNCMYSSIKITTDKDLIYLFKYGSTRMF